VAGALRCKELVELITEYLEGTLPSGIRKRIEIHLAFCDGCHASLEQMHFAIRAMGMLTEESLTGRAKAELLETFRGSRLSHGTQRCPS
jgi:hypothetical protein